MKLLRQSLTDGAYLLDLDAHDLESVFKKTAEYLVAEEIVKKGHQDEVKGRLQERENISSTAIGHAVAVPHAYLESVSVPIVVFVRLEHPINLGAPDGIPTRFIFVLLGPPEAAASHLDTLTTVARLMADDEFRYEAGEATNVQQLLDALDHFTKRTEIASQSDQPVDFDELAYSPVPFHGIREDILRRIPHYWSDFRDGLHSKCVGSTLFLFFACLAPAVTFGGIMAVQTGGQIGAIEMLVTTAACGIVYALLAGQPLQLLGGTGPMLILTGILYQLCSDLNIPFLPTYAWTGLWTALILLILSAMNACSLLRFFSRFTTEIFSALISLIFIYEAIKSIAIVFQDLDIKKHHDTALLSLLLAAGTYLIAMKLSQFRRSAYLLPKMREFLTDFGPAIALGAMTVVAILLHEVTLDTLPSPDSFGTSAGRPWRIDLMAAPLWTRFATIVPALFVALLAFLNQNITAKLVNTPEHQLKKGGAYHYDLALVGILIGVCSIFGLPWLVAAFVPSLNHVRSLASVEEVVAHNGQVHERIIHVRENRLSGLTIHILIGASLLLLGWLKMIPMAVLYGLFLFMGVVSMSGNQLFERLSLWLKDSDLYPITHYIRRVPHWTIHKFTFVQVVCLGFLWVVKSSFVGILFPLFIALLVPLRLLLNKFFDRKALAILDAQEIPEEEETNWSS